MYKKYQIRHYVVLQIVIVECRAPMYINTEPHKFSSKNYHFQKTFRQLLRKFTQNKYYW